MATACQRLDRVAVTGAFLTDIKAGEREPEDVHLVQKGVQGFAAQLCGDQAVADQFKVAPELIDRGVVKGLIAL